MWVSWRVMRGKGNWLREMNEWELVEELTASMALLLGGEEKQGVDRGGEAGSGELIPRAVGGGVLAAAALQDQGGEKGDQEGARGGREPNVGEETASMGDDQGHGGEHSRGVGWVGEDSVDRLGIVVPAVAEGIGIACKGGRWGVPGLLLEEGRHCLFRESRTAGAGEAGGGAL